MKVIYKFSTPYHPQTNGLVESFNGTLVQTLRKLTLKQLDKWDEWIATALYIYRTRVHSTLNITPYEMLYGVAPRNSDPIQFASQLLEEESLLALEDKRDQVYNKFNKRQAHKWFPEHDYKKGDTVLVKRGKKRKIQTPWYETPYLIYQAHENNTYDLIDTDGEFFRSRVNGKNLKSYHDNIGMFTHFNIL